MTADMDSTPTCVAQGGTGFLSPLLYAVASNPAEYAASFNDIAVGNNDGFGLTGGQLFPATPGYDMASGLGTPRITGPDGTAGLASYVCSFASSPTRPVVTGLSPSQVSASGDVTVTVSGSGFQASGSPDVAGIQVGTVHLLSAPAGQVGFRVNSDTSITLTVPAAGLMNPQGTNGSALETYANGAGRYDVVVSLNSGLSSVPSAASVLTYVDQSPSQATVPSVVAVITPGGPLAGDNTVSVIGSGFSGATGVTFGGQAGTHVDVRSDHLLTVEVPPFSAGVTSCAHDTDPTTDVCQTEVVVAGPGGSSSTEPILPPATGQLDLNSQDVPVPPAGCGCEVAPAQPSTTTSHRPTSRRPPPGWWATMAASSRTSTAPPRSLSPGVGSTCSL